MRKQRKARASMRKKKRQRARNKRASKKNNISRPGSDYKEEEETKTTKKDSLKYSFRSEEKERYVVIRFTKKERLDSILVKYPGKGNDISVYEKQLLKLYVDSNKIENIDLIKIREHKGSKDEDAHSEKHASPVKKSISEFFIQLGVPPEKIKIRE